MAFPTDCCNIQHIGYVSDGLSRLGVTRVFSYTRTHHSQGFKKSVGSFKDFRVQVRTFRNCLLSIYPTQNSPGMAITKKKLTLSCLPSCIFCRPLYICRVLKYHVASFQAQVHHRPLVSIPILAETFKCLHPPVYSSLSTASWPMSKKYRILPTLGISISPQCKYVPDGNL